MPFDHPGFTTEERIWMNRFYLAAKEKFAACGISPSLNIPSIAVHIRLDPSSLNKEDNLLYALWIVLLSAIREQLPPEHYKYQSMKAFLDAYEGWFTHETEQERTNLWQTANWMSILFKIISARKNKGLAMQVVPKLLEGWEAKYVTGSGQTKATANRVHIFEVEGNTKASPRGKVKKNPFPETNAQGKRFLGAEATDSSKHQHLQKKKKRNQKSADNPSPTTVAARNFMNPFEFPTMPMNGGVLPPAGFREPSGSFAEMRERRLMKPGHPNYGRIASHSADGSEGTTDGEDSEFINEDVRKAFSQLRDVSITGMIMRDESFGLGLNLSRNNSLFNGLSVGSDLPLNMPTDYQRGFSWNEIPLTPLSKSEMELASSAYNNAAGSSNEVQFHARPSQLHPADAVVPSDALSEMFQGYQTAV